MKIWFEDDEYYPWFTPVTERPTYWRAGGKDGLDVDPETVQRWKNTIAEAEKVQHEIYEAARQQGTWR